MAEDEERGYTIEDLEKGRIAPPKHEAIDRALATEQFVSRALGHQDNRWSKFAEQAECEYCGEDGPTIPDPFGQRPACRPCWEMIAYGGDDD